MFIISLVCLLQSTLPLKAIYRKYTSAKDHADLKKKQKPKTQILLFAFFLLTLFKATISFELTSLSLRMKCSTSWVKLPGVAK